MRLVVFRRSFAPGSDMAISLLFVFVDGSACVFGTIMGGITAAACWFVSFEPLRRLNKKRAAVKTTPMPIAAIAYLLKGRLTSFVGGVSETGKGLSSLLKIFGHAAKGGSISISFTFFESCISPATNSVSS